MSRAHVELLRRIFAVIIAQAERDGELAHKLAQALGAPAAPKTAKAPRRGFDARHVHAINILRMHGEAALRGKLEEVRSIADLRAVATASGLVLAGSAQRRGAARTEVIAAIIAAAKHYDAQRSAART